MTSKNVESVSALVDDELNKAELDALFSEIHDEEKSTFGRYGLIGDVMRNEQSIEIDESFAAGIQNAIANLPQEQAAPEQETPVVSIASHPKWHQQVAAKVMAFGQSSTGRGMSQLAIAASVALVAIVGVNNLAPTQQNPEASSPVIQTVPLVSGISPVSTDGLKSKPDANQVTQSRINALTADHNQQLRAADEEENKQQEDKIEQ